MKIEILGCGGSLGVPLIGNIFGKCNKNNSKNFRTRPGILIKNNKTNILIDSNPDIRIQLLKAKCSQINAILYTHKHADHIHGINDLRAVSMLMKKKIPAWGSKETIEYLKNNFGYIFNYKYIKNGGNYKKKDFYKPIMNLNLIQNNFYVNNVQIISFQHNHGDTNCTTYRIGNFAYTTDIKKFYNGDINKLLGIKKWVVGCLRMDKHPSHASFEEVLEFINYIKPNKTYLTHLTPWMDYDKLLAKCPKNVEPAYDGLQFEVN